MIELSEDECETVLHAMTWAHDAGCLHPDAETLANKIMDKFPNLIKHYGYLVK